MTAGMESQDNRIKKKVFSGMIWAFGEQFSAQAISFVLSVILARLLMPEEYGIITMVLVFINIANVFVTDGFGEALVQRKNATDEDFTTVFYCSLAVSGFLYCVLYITSPLIAAFYDAPELALVLRILALKLPIASINSIQRAYVQKNMQFKKFFFSTLGGTILSGVLGIFMAYKGFGVWALVAQYMSNSCVATIVMFFSVKWKPSLVFCKSSAKELIRYAWKLTAASLINTLYNELRSLIIGKKYSTLDLAYYNKGNHIPSLAITNMNSAISTVIFPAMSQCNNEPNRLKAITRRSMKVAAFVIFPVMGGIIGIGKPLIRLLLTEKWLPCVPYLYMACMYWACQPVQTANWQVIKAIGRSDLALKLEIYKKIIGFFLILVSIPFGVKAMAASNVLFAIISMLINIIPNKRLINYSIHEQLFDLAPSFFSSFVMCLIVLEVGNIVLPDIVLLPLQVAIGIAIYVFCSILLKNDSFSYIIDILNGFMAKRREKI